MANLSFITSGGNSTTYTIVDTSMGLTNPPYTAKDVQLTALDGTLLYDSGTVPISTLIFQVQVTSDWTTHLAIAQIVVNIFYFQGTNSETVSHTYTTPTVLNVQTS